MSALIPTLVTVFGLVAMVAAVVGLAGWWWALLFAGAALVVIGERADW